MDILILGGGVAGLTAALALTKFAPKNFTPRIRIFEIRPIPATIGGAVNLTPNALRLLDHFGVLERIQKAGYGETINAVEVFDVYSGKLAESSFRGPNGDGLGDPPYKVFDILHFSI
jgi:salicylate hydroxylase